MLIVVITDRVSISAFGIEKIGARPQRLCSSVRDENNGKEHHNEEDLEDVVLVEHRIVVGRVQFSKKLRFNIYIINEFLRPI